MKTTVITVLMMLSFYSCMTADKSKNRSIDFVSYLQQKEVEQIDIKYKVFVSGIEVNHTEIRLELFFKKHPYKTVK